ncbi:recombinase family protein [Streptomyces goshikiensis]|uniref:recombinase family protein n=2 Tax=Streptomyces goshikiensis TaxID=1942 RepID=UPI0037029C56
MAQRETTCAGKGLFVVFAVMAEVEREFIHERTLTGLDTAAENGNHGSRPPAVDMLAVAPRRHDAKESVASITRAPRRRPLHSLPDPGPVRRAAIATRESP